MFSELRTQDSGHATHTRPILNPRDASISELEADAGPCVLRASVFRLARDPAGCHKRDCARVYGRAFINKLIKVLRMMYVRTWELVYHRANPHHARNYFEAAWAKWHVSATRRRASAGGRDWRWIGARRRGRISMWPPPVTSHLAVTGLRTATKQRSRQRGAFAYNLVRVGLRSLVLRGGA